MKTLEKVSDFVGKYMAAIVIVVAAGALFYLLASTLSYLIGSLSDLGR